MSEPVRSNGNAYSVADPAEFSRNMMKVAAQSRASHHRLRQEPVAAEIERPCRPSGLESDFRRLPRPRHAQPGQTRRGGFPNCGRAIRDAVAPHDTAHDGPADRADDRTVLGRQALQGQGLAGEPGLRLHQAVLSADRELDADDRSRKVDGRRRQDTRKRVEFYTKQFADAIAPTNFVLTNPEVLRAHADSPTARTWSRAWSNLLDDLERGKRPARRSARPTRCLQDRREHRHHAGQGGVPQRADRAHPVRRRRRSRSTRCRC